MIHHKKIEGVLVTINIYRDFAERICFNFSWELDKDSFGFVWILNHYEEHNPHLLGYKNLFQLLGSKTRELINDYVLKTIRQHHEK